MSERHYTARPAATRRAARSLPAPPGRRAAPPALEARAGRALRRLRAGALVLASALVAGASVGLAAPPGASGALPEAPAQVPALPPEVPALLAALPGGIGAAAPAGVDRHATARRSTRTGGRIAVPLPHEATAAAAGSRTSVDSARVGVDLFPQLRLGGPEGWPGDGPVLGLIRLRVPLFAPEALRERQIGSKAPPNPHQFGQSGRNR